MPNIGMSRSRRWGIWAGVIAGSAALIPLIPLIRGRYFRITTILKKDHRMVSGLLKMLENTPRMNGTARRSLLDKIHRELVTHEMAEDEVLYRTLRSRDLIPTGSVIDDLYHEQYKIKDLLNRLVNSDVDGAEFMPQLRNFMEVVERHAEQEEKYVFPIVEREFSGTEQETFGRQITAFKKGARQQAAA
jgi:hemerythrin superfamily protein